MRDKHAMKDMRLWAWKAVNVDFTTRGGFVWPFPGNGVSSADNLDPDNNSPCPTREGDGLCLAKTWAGAAARGIATHTVLVVSYFADDVLGEDRIKLRVKRCHVFALWNAHKLLRQFGDGAHLEGANLEGADLHGAILRGANLGWANLRGASLRYANLRRADLRCANLDGVADLRGANLSGADLRGADLRGANLRGADLGGANLVWANLRGASLRYANLRGANLRCANLDGVADLRGANLGGADLSGAIYTKEQLVTCP